MPVPFRPLTASRSAIAQQAQVLLGDRQLPALAHRQPLQHVALRIDDAVHQARAQQAPAVAQRRVHHGDLQRRDLHQPLADGRVVGVAGHPRLSQVALLPFGGWHQAGGLAGRSMPLASPNPKARSYSTSRRLPNPVRFVYGFAAGDVVEVDVARLRYAPVQVDHAVPGCQPVVERPAGWQHQLAVAPDLGLRQDDSGFERCRGRNDLVAGARGVQAGHRMIDERAGADRSPSASARSDRLPRRTRCCRSRAGWRAPPPSRPRVESPPQRPRPRRAGPDAAPGFPEWPAAHVRTRSAPGDAPRRAPRTRSRSARVRGRRSRPSASRRCRAAPLKLALEAREPDRLIETHAKRLVLLQRLSRNRPHKSEHVPKGVAVQILPANS